MVVAILPLAFVYLSFAQATVEFHRTLPVNQAEIVSLDVEVPNGELRVLYGQEGQVSISALASTSAEIKLDANFFSGGVSVEQSGNHLTIRHVPNSTHPEDGIKVLYRIDVPYRTEVTSRLIRGKQSISGILGPATAAIERGDITAAFISKGLQAEVGHGNLDIQVIGEHVVAKTGGGNISCARLTQGVSAETEDGDITVMVVGPSTAIVKKGTGRIDVGGARGSFIGSTDEGELHIKAIPHEDWKLNSGSGSVRLELPPVAKVELEASTKTGELQVDREDMAKPDAGVRQIHQYLNGGGRRIQVQTQSGIIAIR
jgi:hypothetical protein